MTTPISASSILINASDTITKRGKERDPNNKERSMLSTIQAFNALTNNNISETDGWKFMICLKLARAKSADYKFDDYLDLTAYSALAGECEDAKQKDE